MMSKFKTFLLMTLSIQLAPAQTLDFGNGVNLQPSYYNKGNVDFGWGFMNKFDQIKTVRIEMDPSRITDISIFGNWIKEANNHGYKVIATYHTGPLGSPDPKELLKAANWWKANYAQLHEIGGDFTINLSNEWGDHTVTSKRYADAYNTAIKIIREFYQGWIICDLSGWGQETKVAAEASSLISDDKIIFSAHIYPSAYNAATGNYLQVSDLDYLKNVGKRPVIVGEFGSKPSSGKADWSALIDHAKSLEWTVLAWAWNGDGGDAEQHFMNMVAPAWYENPKPTKFSKSDYFDEVYDKLS